MSKFFSFLLFGLATFSACKTTEPTPLINGPRKAMLSYKEAPLLPDLWEKWTPITKTQIPALFPTASPFDYWEIKDDNEIERVWSILSTVLSGLRSETQDEELKLAIRSTLTLLEPTPIDRSVSTLDLTFLTSSFSEKPIDRWEGIVIRWFKKTYDATPTITLFLSRQSKSKTGQFDRVHLWIESGFSELPIQSIKMQLNEKWNYQIKSGPAFNFKEGEPKDAKIYVNALAATLWNNYTNAAYVKYEKMVKESKNDAFGKVKLRDIEMVFESTQFPPRFNF